MQQLQQFFNRIKAHDLPGVREMVAAQPALVCEPDDEGMTGLHYAAMYGHTYVAQFLCEHGADLAAQEDGWHATPLGWAIFYGKADTAELLLKAGATANAENLQTALQGEAGDWREWSSSTPAEYHRVVELLRANRARNSA